MAEAKLIAVLPNGRAFTLRLDEGMEPEAALLELTRSPKGGRELEPWAEREWLDTEEQFHIRRDAIVALVVGHKQGDYAVAGAPS